MLLFAILMTSIGIATAQNRVVKGQVTSSTDGLPVVGASVVVKENPTIGENTDMDGHFSLTVPASAKKLIVSFIGMKTKEVAITDGEMKIILDEDQETLDNVVVTGYTSTTKKAFTGAASSVSDAKVKAKFDANPINSLKGNVPGVSMTNFSGQPGSPTTIFIRGRNSINSGTQPLYVIDGVPMDTSVIGIRSDEGASASPLASISSDDIASITVLRDATATSIYGARAANGVIVITTKKGTAGFKMNFSTRLGASTLPATSGSRRYRPVDATTWTDLFFEGVRNAYNYADILAKTSNVGGFYNDFIGNESEGKFPLTEEGMTKLALADFGIEFLPRGEKGTNWFNEVFRTGLLQNYNLDISGGGESPRSPRYYVAFDYLKEDGIMIGKDLTRYSMRANISQAPYEFFDYGINTSLSLTEINMGASGGYFSDPMTQSFMLNPHLPVKLKNGDWNFNTNTGYNPVAIRSEKGDKNFSKQYRALVSPFATIKFLDWLSFTSRMGADIMLIDEFGYWSFLQPQGRDMRGMGENGNFTRYYLSITNTLNINKNWGNHHLNALIGQEGQKRWNKDAYLSSSNYAVDYLNDISLASSPSDARTSRFEMKLLSFFANAEYDYDQRYFASFSARVDASSRFHKNNRWAPFFSVGGKWRIASEEFMQSSKDYVQDLTIRSSFGTTGNQEVGSGWYAARGLYDYGYSYNNRPGMLFVQYENPDLKWEKTSKFNVGLDARFFDIISLTFDYYLHHTTDMVFGVPLAKEVGLPTYYSGVRFFENIGKLRNQGIEFELGIDAINTNDHSLRFSFTGSHNQNRVLKLSTDLPINRDITTIRVGHDIYTWYMREWAGVDPQTGVGMWWTNKTDKDGNVIEREKTYKYNEANQIILGKASPDFVGGFRTDYRYKDFDFSILLQYSIGGTIYADHLRYDEHGGSNIPNAYIQYVADNHWKQPGDNAEAPLMFVGAHNWNQASSRFLMNGSYLKIQNIMLGYTLKNKAFSNIGLSSIRFFASFDNVYTFVGKKYRGLDPASVAASGVQWWNYPIPFKFTGGVTFSF